MDSYDPQQIAQDREIIAEATAKSRIRPLFPTGEPTGAAHSRRPNDGRYGSPVLMGPPPIGDGPSVLTSGQGEGL